MYLGQQLSEDIIGTVLDGVYRIDSLLGVGGMGAVYQATHLRLDKRVAVKLMSKDLTANPDALARFHREARVTSGLGHPHIVQVFDFSATPTGEPFLVMELLEGEALDHRLSRVGHLTPGEVVRVVKHVASALAATHAKSIVHRDLKPGNIFLVAVAGETDFVKVLDFGISKVRSASTKLTRTSSIMGTPNYMSPEQADGKIEEIDEGTDQWALACIAYECLSGAGPFQGDSVPSILYHIVHKAPPPLVPQVAGLPPEAEKVLLRALAKKKGERFPSVSSFAMALENAIAGTTSVASPGLSRSVKDFAPLPPKATTFTQGRGEFYNASEIPDLSPSRPKWIWGMFAIVAIVFLLGAFLLLRPSPAPKPDIANPPTVTPVSKPPSDKAPSAPLPEEEPPATGQVEPSAREAESKVSAKTPSAAPLPKKSLPVRVLTPEERKADGVSHKKRRTKKQTSEENQDQWRVE
jgi:serine/threonine protein kinase